MVEPKRRSQELDSMVHALHANLGESLWALVLFGSAARGEARNSSDLDVFIVADSLPHRFSARGRLLRSLIPKAIVGRISFIAKTRDEFEQGFPSYYLDLALDGVILFDRDRYMAWRFERIRSLIQDAGLIRLRTQYGFFWRWAKPPAGPWRIDWSGVYGL
jgi:predicted nucleotidyltransferase